ncbi:MAG TPA: alpha/beta hydrolase [Coleofasciculaceae cyanobacterium]
MVIAQNIRSGLISLVLGVSSVFFSFSVAAAERIAFNFPPLGQFDIKVEDLEAFANQGEISAELAYYLDRLPPEQLARLPEILSTPLEFDPLTIAKFSNSSIGEAVIKNFGKGIRGDIERNGFYALRGAIIAAAFDDRGLTIINLLRQFPLSTVYLDLKVLTQYIQLGTALASNREAINQTWFADDEHRQGANNHHTELNRLPDLKISGKYTWNKQTITYNNPRRPNPGYFDLYQPSTKQPVSLIVISHGVASNRLTFAYLAKHLVSHGFAVAVIEHDDISLNKFDRFLAGQERFPEPNNLIDQPLDVKYALDKLESESKINLQQVGIIGQSFGGYTSLALAGGELIADQTATECEPENYRDVLLDLSSLAKCTLNELNQPRIQLKDPRIKAVIAINPMGKIFGKAGMSSIQVPTMLVSGTNDLIMPPVTEQIRPFSWLDGDLDKYLVLFKPGTHFSFLQEGLGVLPIPNTVVGPSPTSAHPALKTLSTAFFKVYLAQQPEYQTYLQSDRSNQLSNDVFELSIIRFLTTAQLEEIINN